MATTQHVQAWTVFRNAVASNRCPECGSQATTIFGTTGFSNSKKLRFTPQHPAPSMIRSKAFSPSNAEAFTVLRKGCEDKVIVTKQSNGRSSKVGSCRVYLHARKQKPVHAAAVESRPETEESTAGQQKEDISHSFDRKHFPLSSIVGNEAAKTALLIAAIDPRMGGIAIAGPRGTAKTVMARAFPALLPQIEVVVGSWANADPNKEEEWESGLSEKLNRRKGEGRQVETQWRDAPFVQVPLNITEDRLLGSVDLEKSLQDGRAAFQPGLLAEAHQGVLYVDNLNLLDDGVANLLFNAVDNGYNTVEREGLSVWHPCRPAAIIATWDPEEGQLRPHLLDRLAMHVTTSDGLNSTTQIELPTSENGTTNGNGKHREGSSNGVSNGKAGENGNGKGSNGSVLNAVHNAMQENETNGASKNGAVKVAVEDEAENGKAEGNGKANPWFGLRGLFSSSRNKGEAGKQTNGSAQKAPEKRALQSENAKRVQKVEGHENENGKAKPQDTRWRTEAVSRVLDFSNGSGSSARSSESGLREVVKRGKEILKEGVTLTREQTKYLVQESIRGECEGHRAEAFAARVAKAHAALRGARAVNADDLRAAVQLAILPRSEEMEAEDEEEDKEEEKQATGRFDKQAADAISYEKKHGEVSPEVMKALEVRAGAIDTLQSIEESNTEEQLRGMNPEDAEGIVSLMNELANYLQMISPDEADSVKQVGLISPIRLWDQKRSVLRRLFQQKSALEKAIGDAQKDENPSVAVMAMAQVNLGFKNKDANPADSNGSGGTEDKEKVTFDQRNEDGPRNEEGGKEGAGEMGSSEEGEGPQVGSLPSKFTLSRGGQIADPELLAMMQLMGKRKLSKDENRGSVGRNRKNLAESTLRGRYVKSIFPRSAVPEMSRVAIDATLRASAPHQRARLQERLRKNRPESRVKVQVRMEDIREKKRIRKATNLVVFVVDTSGSMEAFLQSVREAVIGLLDKVYVNRDQVAIIQFQKSGATVLLPPTRSVQEARKCVELISQTGGRTPIARALLTGFETGLAAQKRREVEKVLIVAITDADPNVSLSGKKGTRLSYGATWASAFFQTGQKTMVDVQNEVLDVARVIGNQKNVQLLVIDPEKWNQKSFGEEIARAGNGRYFPLPNVSAESITSTVLDTMAGM